MVVYRSQVRKGGKWPDLTSSASLRRGGRVADCTGLENRRGVIHRGFESHPLRFVFFRTFCGFHLVFGNFSRAQPFGTPEGEKSRDRVRFSLRSRFSTGKRR